MQYIKSDLISALDSAGHPLMELKDQRGSLLILPYGARVLGLFSISSENFYWVNPMLVNATDNKTFFSSTGWKNSGGDRTWIAPEINLFIKDSDDPWNSYEVPATIDPGNYVIQSDNERLMMTNQAEIVFHNLKKECKIEIKKVIQIADNPLCYEKEAPKINQNVEYIGYEQYTSLRLLSMQEKGMRLGIWNLVQLPASGNIIIPTVMKSRHHDFFEKTTSSHIHITSRYIKFLMDGRERHKIGVKATSLMGRVGYIRSVGDGKKSLLIRNFLINPSGKYIDTPWDSPEDFGYAIQCYNDNGELGSFGEMEYHTPAIGYETKMDSYVDQSQVWAFWGDGKSIDQICRYLLGVKFSE
jgi:hypothetical protein